MFLRVRWSTFVVRKMESMAVDESTLVEAIRNEPNDDALRLVYADWLTEHGNAKGEWIQLQIALHGLKPWDLRFDSLTESCASWLARHPSLVSHSDPRLVGIGEVVWERGFVSAISLDMRSLDWELLAQIPVRYPLLRTLRLIHCTADEFFRLVEQSCWSQIRELDLSGNRLGTEFVEQLSQCSWCSQLESLDLSQNRILDQGAQILAASPYFTSLCKLELRRNHLSNPAVTSLVRAPWFGQLVELDLSENHGITFYSWQTLMLRTEPNRLRKVGLEQCNLGRDFMRMSPHSGEGWSLTQLSLDSNQLASQHMDAISSVQFMTQIQELSVGNNPIGVTSMARLVQTCRSLRKLVADGTQLNGNTRVKPLWDWPLSLRSLDLSHNHLTDISLSQMLETLPEQLSSLSLNHNDVGKASLHMLTQSAFFPALRQLGLRFTRLTNEGVVRLMKSSHFPSLTKLDLGYNHLNSEAVRCLVGQDCLSGLLHLWLPGNQIDALGAHSLATAPILNELATLDLAENALSNEGARALAESKVLGNLRRLSLRRNRVTSPGAMALSQSTSLSRVQDLDCSENNIGQSGTEAVANAIVFRQLQSLDLSFNALGDAAAHALAHSEHLSQLKELNLRGNHLQEPGAKAIFYSTKLSGLIKLNLSDNRIPVAARQVLTLARLWSKPFKLVLLQAACSITNRSTNI
jgi:uncharacterized protein (TIGR02996 family)